MSKGKVQELPGKQTRTEPYRDKLFMVIAEVAEFCAGDCDNCEFYKECDSLYARYSGYSSQQKLTLDEVLEFIREFKALLNENKRQ